MQWFEGSIVEAITAAKSSNAIFVVYVHDSSETSTQTDLVLSNSEVSSVLSSSQFIAIKLENGTDGAKQFSQIYPLVLVPSLFFISGQSGVPLEIVGGSFSHDDLMKKLQKLNPTCGQDTVQSSQPIIENQETQESKSSEMKDISTLEKDSSQEALSSTSLATSSIEVPATQSLASTSTEAPETQSLISQDKELSVSSEDPIGGPNDVPLDDRISKAKVLLEEKQEQKQKEMEEEQRRKEIERREVGKEMAKQRQMQHEEELKTAAQERKKDKQEDRIARERVKAQIAADRADREARNAALRGEQPQVLSASPSDSMAAAAASAPPSTSQSNHGVCRIKFRLPDGSSSIAQFPTSSSLSVVREHVNNNIEVPFRTFAMTSTMRPQPFSQDDMERSLTDLDLAPSAILIITPGPGSGGRGAISTSEGSFLNFFWLILSPITFILGLIRSMFGAGGREQSRDPRHDQEFKAEEPVSKKPREEGSETTRKRPKTAYGSRREGNIHRFSNRDDDDDENGTWNGNSTQQM